MAEKSPLTSTNEALARIARSLEALGAAWALVGGLAVSARAEPRFTRDVDVAIRIESDAQAEALIWSLHQHGYSIRTVLEHKKLRRLATARLVHPEGPEPHVIVDLLFSSSGIESEIVARATRMRVPPGLDIPVARSGHLIAMKILAQNDRTRPQDYGDLVALLKRSNATELERARRALAKIQALGAHRGKRLLVALDRLVERLSAPSPETPFRRRVLKPRRAP